MEQTAYIKRRDVRAIESFGNAAAAIGPIERGMSVFAITRGQWSMIDAILHVLDQVGKSRLTIWTWTIAAWDADLLGRLMIDNRITSATLMIDQSTLDKNKTRSTSQSKSIDVIQQWRRDFGQDSVRYVRNHAKIATIESESGFKILMRGSMNLNLNTRFEQFDLSEGCKGFDLVRQLESEFPILGDDCTQQDAHRASKTQWTTDLSAFRKVKVWQK